jgi:hypothetical protein
MLFREKLAVGFCGLLFLIGVADLNTPYVNLFWERHLGFSGRFMVLQGEKVGYVNARSRLMIRPKFDGGVGYFNQDLTPVLSGRSWGFIDVAGQWIIAPKFLTAEEFKEDLAAVSLPVRGSRKFGFIDRAGKLVIPAVYAQVGTFSEGMAPAKSAGLWGYLNPSGQWAIPLKFEEAQDFSEKLAAVKVNGLWGYVDRHGLFFIQPQFADAKVFHDGRAPVKVGERWGYIDTKGQWVIEPSFITAGVFSDGLAAVNDSGYIDTDGRVVVKAGRFGHAHDFSEGLAAVQQYYSNKYKIGKWGYIDRQGRWVIQPRFEIAKDFTGGMARVSKDKNNTQRGYIHHDGNLVWDPADWETTALLKGFFKTVGTVAAIILPFYVMYVLREREKQFYFLQTIS